ncbi:MAG: hypothetical protein FWF73_04155 [Spirochaetes bacterium]|nr:hypothetical protein [Spirochaetota bacterium]
MPIDLESAASNLSEQTKRLQIALYYTSGDDEKAKKMINGTYLDLFLIKAKFSSSSVYGAFIIFLNIPNLRVENIYSIISRSFEIADIKTTQTWRNFEDRLVDTAKKGDFDEVMTAKVNEALAKSLNMQEIDQFSQLIDQDNGIAVSHNFQKFFSDVTGYQNVTFSVDYEKISSLSMELQSITSTKITNLKIKNKKEDVNVEAIDDSDDPLAGKDVRLLVRGALILSPIKGKDISELIIGDKVMISVIDKGEKAIELLKAFNAYNEENRTAKPIVGRIVSISHTTDFKIHAIVAKGIYVKIVEEENFIKVAMDSTYYGMQFANEEKASKKNKMTIYILTAIFLVLLAAVLLLLFSIF